MAFAFGRQTRNYGKRAAAYGLGLLAFGGLSTMNYLNTVASREEDKLNKVKKNLEEFKVRPLSSQESTIFPWTWANLDEWEYKLIKVRGYFKEQRMYVKKTKDGKTGYAVFAPFVTSAFDPSDDPRQEDPGDKEIFENGVMVNLGWIPVENKDEVKGTDEPLPLVEWDENSLAKDVSDPHTGFEYKRKYNEETEVKPKYADLTAIVRKGEKPSLVIGNVNFPRDKLFQFIDLDLFGRLFMFANHDTSRMVYLERIVPSHEGDEPVFPIAATKDNFLINNDGPTKLRSMASKITWASMASLILMIPALLL